MEFQEEEEIKSPSPRVEGPSPRKDSVPLDSKGAVPDTEVGESTMEILERAERNKLMEICLMISESRAFNAAIILLIITNTVIMSLDKHPISESQIRVIEIANYVFYACFALEMAIKLLGLGFKYYFRDRFNLFDAVIVVISTIEICLSQAKLKGTQNSALSVFRGFRILRLLKLVKSWEKLQELLSIIANTLKDIRNFTILLFICLFTYTLLGLEFFAYKMKFNEED